MIYIFLYLFVKFAKWLIAAAEGWEDNAMKDRTAVKCLVFVWQDVKLADLDQAVQSHVIALARLHATHLLEGASVPQDGGDRDVRKVMALLPTHFLENIFYPPS